MLEIVGTCPHRIFNLSPVERLRRQLEAINRQRTNRGHPPLGLVARACAVFDDAAIAWLFEHQGEVLGTPDGRPLAVVMPIESLAEGRRLLEGGAEASRSGSRQFVRKLRRQVEMLAVSADELDLKSIERRLYRNVYKGVTDVVTKYVWPEPAFHVTRLCAALNVKPNTVTIAGMVMMLLAAWLFWRGQFVGGLAAAWSMTFLDTVDGKLARVTAQSSKIGNLLDHGTDMLHPPLWWWAVTIGAAKLSESRDMLLWYCFIVIVMSYVLSRLVEEGFKLRFGFNAFLWRPFDSRFRLIVSRRNILLLILTAGVLIDRLSEAWIAAAAWSVLSLLIQTVRLMMAEAAYRRGEMRAWLE